MKRMRIYLTLLVAAVFTAAGLTGCGGDEEESAADTTVLFPLEVGNEWVYNLSKYDENFELLGESTDTVKVTLEWQIDTLKWHYVYTASNFNYTMMLNMPEGLYWWRCNAMQSPEGEPFLAFKYPAEKGESWFFANKIMTLEDTSETVYTEYGTFDALRYKLEDSLSTQKVYFSIVPDTGIVKIENEVEGSVIMSLELKELTLIDQ